MATLVSVTIKYLADPNTLSSEQLDWAIDIEGLVRILRIQKARGGGAKEERCWLDACIVEAPEIVSATCRLYDKHLNHLRSLAATDNLIDIAIAELINVELAEANNIRSRLTLVMKKTIALKEMLTRGVPVCARRPGEEALVQALVPLDKHVATVKTQLTTSQAFATTISRYRALFAMANNPVNTMHKRSTSPENPEGPP
uniref:Uncharacterized protein n=1 Tax=Oryza brachyantha TaxID=4533 RepID=J3N562_ORYBR